MTISVFHAYPPNQDAGNQIVAMVGDNVTDLSMLAVPPSNLQYEIYRRALSIEVAVYLQRVGEIPNEPVEVIVATSDADPHEVLGFLLYSPVPNHPEACGINYMAVKATHRRQGLGSAMVRRMLERYPHAELTCFVKKVPFYESLGFQVLDSQNTQVVMNTRNASSEGLMAVLNVEPIYTLPEVEQIKNELLQRWGRKEMQNSIRQLERHIGQISRQAQSFVAQRQSSFV